MTIGIKTKNGNVYTFSAVQNYTESHSASVTKHPVERKAVITDHVINEQSSYRLSGVITPYDLGGNDYELALTLASFVEDISYVYNGPAAVESSAVTINSNVPSNLLKFLPESVSAFVNGQTLPTVEMQELRGLSLEGVKELFITMKESGEILDLLLFDGPNLKTVVKDCVFTSLEITEGPETGESLELSATLVKIQFVSLNTTQIPKLTWTTVDTSDKTDKGVQQGSSYGTGSPSDKATDPPAAGAAQKECTTADGQTRSPINCMYRTLTDFGTDLILGD